MTEPVQPKPKPQYLRFLKIGETAIAGDWCADHNTGKWGKIGVVVGDTTMRTMHQCERFARPLTEEEVGERGVVLSKEPIIVKRFQLF